MDIIKCKNCWCPLGSINDNCNIWHWYVERGFCLEEEEWDKGKTEYITRMPIYAVDFENPNEFPCRFMQRTSPSVVNLLYCSIKNKQKERKLNIAHCFTACLGSVRSGLNSTRLGSTSLHSLSWMVSKRVFFGFSYLLKHQYKGWGGGLKSQIHAWTNKDHKSFIVGGCLSGWLSRDWWYSAEQLSTGHTYILHQSTNIKCSAYQSEKSIWEQRFDVTASKRIGNSKVLFHYAMKVSFLSIFYIVCHFIFLLNSIKLL